MHKVAVVNVDYYAEDIQKTVYQSVREVMELAQWRKFIPRGEDVCLKPNLCIDLCMPGFHTSLWFLEGVIEVLKDYVGTIYLVENDTHTTDVEDGVRKTGLLEVCQRNPHKVKWLNLGTCEHETLLFPKNKVFKKVEIPKILLNKPLITLPVLKTHGLSTMTGAIKNQWGCLKNVRLDYHAVLSQALTELNRIIKPSFCIMDGTIGCEGKGPKQGIPKIANLVLAAEDNVAMDMIACKIMGIPVAEVDHLISCIKDEKRKIDDKDIEVLGVNPLPELYFQYGSRSLLTAVDIMVRKPFLEHLLYHTPIFQLVKLVAKFNYVIWLALIGNRRRDDILFNSRYGRQWLEILKKSK